MSQKINLWRMEEMLKNMNTTLIAVIFLKLDGAYKKFDPEKKYEQNDEVYFNETAFYNAYKTVKGSKVAKLKAAITRLRHSQRTDQVEFMKQHDKLIKLIDEKGKGYDKFDLSFDDVLFSPKFFEDKRLKAMQEKHKSKTPKLEN